MKIDALSNGNVIIKNNDNQIKHVIVTKVFLQTHPRNETAILISTTPTNQDTGESINVFSDKVTSVNGTSFTGSRNDLLLLLSELFKFGGAESESGASAYEIAVNNGFKGIESEWLLSLKGAIGTFGRTFEEVSKNLKSFPNVLNYTEDNLTSIVYTTDTGTITKTLDYTGDNLTSIILSEDTPTGINLTKTLSYVGDNLTNITYS